MFSNAWIAENYVEREIMKTSFHTHSHVIILPPCSYHTTENRLMEIILHASSKRQQTDWLKKIENLWRKSCFQWSFRPRNRFLCSKYDGLTSWECRSCIVQCLQSIVGSRKEFVRSEVLRPYHDIHLKFMWKQHLTKSSCEIEKSIFLG